MKLFAIVAVLSFLLVSGGCIRPAAQSDGVQVTHSTGEIDCGHWLNEFNQALSDARACEQDSDCTFFDVSPVGCWRLYNKKSEPKLRDIGKVLATDRCRIFLPMYKCASKPGEAVCQESVCTWKKSEGGA